MADRSPQRPHHRPLQPGDAFFAELDGGADPAAVREAGDLAATILVRGARESDDPALAERVVHLADSEGLETLAQVWSGAPADTLAGCLWRLFVLRQWVHADPERVAREYDAGQRRAPVARVVAGVADPPGPEELRTMVDTVLRGITGDFAVTLLRAAAFARIVATGRAVLADELADEPADVQPGSRGREASIEPVSRLLALAEQLEAAGHLEMRDALA